MNPYEKPINPEPKPSLYESQNKQDKNQFEDNDIKFESLIETKILPETIGRRFEKTIGGKTKAQYDAELEPKKDRMDPWVKELMEKVELAKEQHKFKLIELSVADLGLTKKTSYDEICKRAKEFGLELCPSELALAMFLDSEDQPEDWRCYIATEAIIGHDLDLGIFELVQYFNGKWLGAHEVSAKHSWFSEDRFVFRIAEQSA